MPAPSDLDEQIVATLRRILRAVSVHSRQLLNGHGISAPQLLMLSIVSKHDGITLSALARTMSLGQSTTSGIVHRLMKQGYVEQEIGKDRRSKLVRATKKGIEKLQASPALLQERFQTELAMRDDYRQTQILATLQEVAGMMEAKDFDAAPILSAEPIAPDSGRAQAKPNKE